MKDFYKFVRMEAQNETHLYIDDVIQASYPWWESDGSVNCPQEFRAGIEKAKGGTLVVHVNSPGGDLTAGVAMFEMIRQFEGDTRCEITWAASAASLIPCACKKSLISPGGVMMIHKPKMMAYGDDKDIEKAKKCYDAWLGAAVAIYQERIKKEEKEIVDLLDQETYFNAQAAIDIGLCDAILPKASAENSPAMSYNRQLVMMAEQESIERIGKSFNRTGKSSEEQEREALKAWAQE